MAAQAGSTMLQYTIVLINNSIKICITHHLCEARFQVDYSGGNWQCTQRLKIDYTKIYDVKFAAI